MFKTILGLSFLFSLAAGAHEGHANHNVQDRPANHGMAVVGHHKVYLSHLPMFHSPHDYQVILEVEFDQTAKAIYDSSAESAPQELYTIAPDEDFVLPEMVKAGNSFPATLFKGHFERGETAIANAVSIKIVNVLYFKKFQANAAMPKSAQYLYFGNEKEQFLAHIITTKPDFDQILSLQLNEKLAATSSMMLDLPTQPNEVPLNVGKLPKAFSKVSGEEFELNAQAIIYFETGDLSF